MSENLEIKDSLYYDDLMYEIKKFAGFEVDCNLENIRRISERKRDTSTNVTIGTTTFQAYCLSTFEEELFEIVSWIAKKANTSFKSLSNISQYPTLVLEALALLKKKKLDNEMLTQLVSVIKDMGLENKFSLGEAREQCVCLNKKDNLWEVYIVERGTSFEKSVHEECFDACVEVINQLADSKQMYEEAKESFGMVKKLVPNK